MNQKKAKAIREFVRSLGKVKAELKVGRTGVIGYTDPVTGQRFRYDLPLTARYPANSFQRAVSMAKRELRRTPVAAIKLAALANRLADPSPAF